MNKMWRYLFISNFSGVYNDNLLKHAIIFIAVGWNLPQWLSQSQLIAIVSASLIIPYLLLSPVGGKLAVRYSKLSIFKLLKLIEFPIMAIAAVSFLLEDVFLAIASVALMGIQSCLYSPAKYGLIRDIGGVEGSAKGSGIFESMAFLGILAGTVTAAWLSGADTTFILIVLFLLLAVAGYLSVSRLKVNELPSEPGLSGTVHLNPLRFMRSSFVFARSFPGINRAVFGVSFFWMTGGVLQMNIVVYASNVLKVSNTVTGTLMALAAVGIIAGSWLAGNSQKRFSKQVLVVAGSLGMTSGFGMLCIPGISVEVFAALVMFIALSGGFFQVPWLTAIQQTTAGRRAGQLLAYMNLAVFVFVLIGTLLFSLTNLLTSDNSVAVFFVLLLLNSIMLFSCILNYYRNKKLI